MIFPKQTLWLCIAALALALTGQLAVADRLPETLQAVRPGVVAVGTIMPTRSPRAKFSGTGFVVGDGRHVVTNHHVVPELIDYEKRETLAIFTGRGAAAVGRRAELVVSDSVHDLALLKIQGESLPALKLGNTSMVREGQEYAFTGFPIGMVLGLYPVTHKGIISTVTPIVIPSISSRKLSVKEIRRMRTPFDVLQLDATAYPGNSGSPLYDIDSGRVIGIVNSVLVKDTKESALERPTGISYAIPVKYIHRLLERAREKAGK